MMPILVKSDDVKIGEKAKVRHGRLRPAQESMSLVRKSKFLYLLVIRFLSSNSELLPQIILTFWRPFFDEILQVSPKNYLRT